MTSISGRGSNSGRVLSGIAGFGSGDVELVRNNHSYSSSFSRSSLKPPERNQGEDLSTLYLYARRLAFKEALDKVQAKYPEHILDLSSFGRYDPNVSQELITNLGERFMESCIEKDVFKEILVEEKDKGKNSLMVIAPSRNLDFSL
ncbi:hypothetical protein ACH5RR_007652 [Cinchona calisaya]|uniref:Uncharacterized protein n=1 Tax=Cinchona calisaya TaxID=153742 RepID=A0ABD3ACZ3_9GENT